MRWWLLTWVVTSALLALWASTVEYGVLVVAIYVALNAIGVGIVMTRRPPYPDRAIEALGWCAAAQLPVLLVPLFDRDLTNPRGAHRDATGGERSTDATDRRREPSPPTNPSDDPHDH